MKLLLVITSLCLILASVCVAKEDRVKIDQPASIDLEIEPTDSHRSRRAAGGKMRFTIHYTNEFRRQRNSGKIRTEVIEKSKEHLESMLFPKSPMKEPIKIWRDCASGGAYFTQWQGKQGLACDQQGCASQTKCLDIKIPEKFLKTCLKKDNRMQNVDERNSGSNREISDMVLVVTASRQRCGGSTLAWAATCKREHTLDRPILGVVNVCTSFWDRHVKETVATFYTVLHEITHALGFSPTNYPYFRDSQGKPYNQRDKYGQVLDRNPSKNVIRVVTRNRKSARGVFPVQVKTIVTPKLLEVAKKHFNCPTIDGLDLENTGGSGSVGSHFEKHIFGNEAMTATSDGDRSVFSPLSLAFLEDTGYYNVDFSHAEHYVFGKNLGCKFVENSCYEFMQDQKSKGKSIAPYCDKVGRTVETQDDVLFCSPHRNKYERCYTQLYQSLPPQFQYFTHAPGLTPSQVQGLGGGFANKNYCPTGSPASYNNNGKNGICYLKSNKKLQQYDGFGETWGSGSRCFDTANAKSGYGSSYPLTYGAACYQTNCDRRRRSLTLRLADGQTHKCQQKGQVINVNYKPGGRYSDWTFDIICPDYFSICEDIQKTKWEE